MTGGPGFGRARAAAGFSSAALALIAAAGPAAAQESLEFPVKANYLVKFAAFVEWPPPAFPSPASPVVICVVGSDPFGPVLDRAAAAHSVRGRRVVTRRLHRIDARSGCHIAYLGQPTEQSTGDALAALADAPVLTVTDAARSRRRGVIHFAVVSDRVRFHIDDRSAHRSRLTISARLLNLALSVRARG